MGLGAPEVLHPVGPPRVSFSMFAGTHLTDTQRCLKLLKVHQSEGGGVEQKT